MIMSVFCFGFKLTSSFVIRLWFRDFAFNPLTISVSLESWQQNWQNVKNDSQKCQYRIFFNRRNTSLEDSLPELISVLSETFQRNILELLLLMVLSIAYKS